MESFLGQALLIPIIDLDQGSEDRALIKARRDEIPGNNIPGSGTAASEYCVMATPRDPPIGVIWLKRSTAAVDLLSIAAELDREYCRPRTAEAECALP